VISINCLLNEGKRKAHDWLEICHNPLPGVDFINILGAAFGNTDPKKHKKTFSSCQSFSHFWDLRLQKLLVEH